MGVSEFFVGTNERPPRGASNAQLPTETKPATHTSDQRFEDIIRAIRPELTSFCMTLTGHRQTAEDLVQTTVLKAWKRRDSFDGRCPKNWFYRIAKNAWIDETRKRRVVTVSYDCVDVEEGCPVTDLI